jgi:CheY-like chemotaxis protein
VVRKEHSADLEIGSHRVWTWRDPKNIVACADSISAQGIDESKTNMKNSQNNSSLYISHSNQFALNDMKSDSTLRILIVDDVPSNRKFLHRILRNEGHICETAVDGQQCVEMVNSKSENSVGYDLVLLDSEMPVMNGPTACKILRGMGHDSLVIIGVTGNVLPEDIQMFMDHGVDAVMNKPSKVMTILDEYKRIKSARQN